MSLLASLAAMVDALDGAGIAHMVAGSVASTYYAEPRTTQDIDIVIDPTPEALAAFVASLDRERFYVGDASKALSIQSSFNVIDVGTGWKIDLIIRRDRPFSLSEFSRRAPAEIGGVAVFVATPEDTILAKLEWAASGGSERQREDADAIIAALGPELDRSYLDRWAAELGVAAALAELF